VLDFLTPVDACRCGYILDMATGKAAPRPGDFSVCLSCGNLLRFTDDLRTRDTTCEDVAVLDEEDIAYIGRVQDAIRVRGPLPPRVVGHG